MAPTFVEMAGGVVPIHIMEGRSLIPLLRGQKPKNWRQFVISEYDYSITPMRKTLNLETWQARLFMVFDGRYKLMHSAGGHSPMLFDLLKDPQEYIGPLSNNAKRFQNHPNTVPTRFPNDPNTILERSHSDPNTIPMRSQHAPKVIPTPPAKSLK